MNRRYGNITVTDTSKNRYLSYGKSDVIDEANIAGDGIYSLLIRL
jgi:hypothetical protein